MSDTESENDESKVKNIDNESSDSSYEEELIEIRTGEILKLIIPTFVQHYLYYLCIRSQIASLDKARCYIIKYIKNKNVLYRYGFKMFYRISCSRKRSVDASILFNY